MVEKKKGGGKQPGAGRPPGSKNKITVTVKEAITKAFDELGGVSYLVQLGQEDPKTFAMLLAKIIPTEIVADVSGELLRLLDNASNTSEGLPVASTKAAEERTTH